LRIMLKLRADQDQKDVSTDYNRMHDFVSGLILKAGQGGIHDKKGLNVFSFSNIFPYGDAKRGDMKKLVIASPSREVIKRLRSVLTRKIWSPLSIGDSRFSPQSVQEFGMKVGAPLKIISATPILLMIPENMYDTYRVPEKERWPGYAYWRTEISQEAFIRQLSLNLIQKYNDYHGTELSHPALFEKFTFRRPVYTRITIEGGKSEGVAASMWEFRWTHLDDVQKEILAFALDAGFGDRNEMGFGFVNVIRERQ